jgi:CRP-like cAMP-binding protein
MEMSPLSLAPSPDAARPQNRLLRLLSDDDLRHLRPHLKTVSLEPKQILHRQGERPRHVYFPNGGVVSMATLLSEGTMVEVATIGDDGIVGIEAFFGDDAVSACETIVQVPVPHESAERLSVQDFRRELVACPTLHHAVARYLEVLYAVMARLTACNVHHEVEARCARWLLTTHDRMHGQEFHLSHEFLAMMLGVRRQSVSAVAKTLRTAGFIRYVHGRVTVLDRKGLEAAACDCYPVIRTLFDRLPS